MDPKIDKFRVIQKEPIRVCVIGLGNVGYPTASHIRKCGFSICGYDIDRKKVLNVNPFMAFHEWRSVPDCNVYIVCVNTNWKVGKPDMSNILDICGKIAAKSKDKPLVSIESTVSVGTCRRVAELFDTVNLVHVPHRYWSKDPDNHGVNQLRVIGALDQESLAIGVKFYETIGVPLHPVSNLETAEMVKIAENAYRFMQIAFAEQLRLICEENNMAFEEVRSAANTKWNIELLEARDGIGGDCLPKDIKFLMSLKETLLLRGATEADKQYVEHLHLQNSKTKKALA